MQVFNLGSPFHRIPPGRFTGNSPALLVASDFDDTYVRWRDYNHRVNHSYLKQNQEAMRTVSQNGLFGIITGRGLSSLKPFARYFKPMRLDFVAVDNGKELFLNSGRQPAVTWLQGLTHAQADVAWKKELQKTARWDQAEVMKSIFDQLSEAGFQRIPVSEYPSFALKTDVVVKKTVHITAQNWQRLGLKQAPERSVRLPVTISIVPDESALYVLKENSAFASVYKAIGQTLARQIETRVAHKSSLSFRYSDHGFYDYYFGAPEGHTISKASIIDFLLQKRLPKSILKTLKGVFVFGDSRNDVPMLERHEYATRLKTTLPSYCVVSGPTLKNLPELKTHPRRTDAPRQGQLKKAILAQYQQFLADNRLKKSG